MLMVPDKPGERTDMGAVEVGAIADSTMDAIVRGTAAGLELLLNIVAMLIVLVALGGAGQCDPEPAAGRRRRADHACSGCSASSWRRCAG